MSLWPVKEWEKHDHLSGKHTIQIHIKKQKSFFEPPVCDQMYVNYTSQSFTRHINVKSLYLFNAFGATIYRRMPLLRTSYAYIKLFIFLRITPEVLLNLFIKHNCRIYGSNGDVFRYWPFVRGIHRSSAQRPVTRSFDVLFYLRLNKRFSKQSWGWWIETPSHPLKRHCSVHSNVKANLILSRDSYC